MYNVANEIEVYRDQLNNDHTDSIMNIGVCQDFSNTYIDKANSVLNCERVIKYLNHLKSNENFDYRDKGFRYLCYWIYSDLLKDNKSIEITLNIYEEFHRKYNEFENYNFDEYLKQFSIYMLENLIKLSELYKIFNACKSREDNSYTNCDCVKDCAEKYIIYVDDCYSGNDNDFCYELENFKQKYENYMKTAACPASVPKTLHSINRHNIAAIVSTPFVIILFTPFGLKIHNLLNRKKRIYNNLDPETKELIYTSGKSNIKSKNNEYSLLYQSVEYP
ncbi:PIR Superfamily Protein [Plasmodium ovale curtisi]|uniref:PIR Superfamily Protein n=1 Tax=Plasmodium ovale curtisi TaxID=864141 RepID=A0A1A8XAT0_PLAOA|nr:PIR Superfamily Protein [Plasmodium ovale curtisi]